MFNLGVTELLVIFFVAYLIVGPEDFPTIVKKIAKVIKKLRGTLKELKAESGWDDIMNEIEEVKNDATSPIEDTKKEISEIANSLEDLDETGND